MPKPPWLPEEPGFPISDPVFWIAELATAHPHAMAFDRLLPEWIRFVVAEDHAVAHISFELENQALQTYQVKT